MNHPIILKTLVDIRQSEMLMDAEAQRALKAARGNEAEIPGRWPTAARIVFVIAASLTLVWLFA